MQKRLILFKENSGQFVAHVVYVVYMVDIDVNLVYRRQRNLLGSSVSDYPSTNEYKVAVDYIIR